MAKKSNDKERPWLFKKIWEDPEEFKEKVFDYIEECENGTRTPTVTGLVFYLGLKSRQALINYSERPEYSDAVACGKNYIKSRYEENLHSPGCTGSIFFLKAMDGWRETDVEESHNTQKVVIEIEDGRKK